MHMHGSSRLARHAADAVAFRAACGCPLSSSILGGIASQPASDCWLAPALLPARTRRCRWAVSGTPLNTQVDDLLGQMCALGMLPFGSRTYFVSTIRKKFEL